MNKESVPYRDLCTEFYELDKPNAPGDALQCYLYYAERAQGKIGLLHKQGFVDFRDYFGRFLGPVRRVIYVS